MAEELKHLIDQIQKEGVEKAEKQADEILAQAKAKAAKIVSEAERKVEELKAKAKTEAESFAERSKKTLEQAARDLLITVGQGCERVVSEILGQEVDKKLKGDLLEKIILNIVEQAPADGLALAVSPEDQKALTAYCATLAKKKKKPIDLVSDSEILSGFRVTFKGDNAYLDFTGEALADALSAFLRPELAKITSQVAREKTGK